MGVGGSCNMLKKDGSVGWYISFVFNLLLSIGASIHSNVSFYWVSDVLLEMIKIGFQIL